VVGSSALFAATHFQLVQFVGLFVAGLVWALLAQRSGRMGPALVSHMAFNLSTVALLYLA
jgi:membrane protease YdiL (CAAX protease family)